MPGLGLTGPRGTQIMGSISYTLVSNRGRPEGSIVKGYGIEEVIEFCVDFVPGLKLIGLPQLWHEGRVSGKGTIKKNQ
jgi:hypothetical protein